MSAKVRQCLALIGVGLILIAGIVLYFSLSLPKVSTTEAPVIVQNTSSDVSKLEEELFVEPSTQQSTAQQTTSEQTAPATTIVYIQESTIAPQTTTQAQEEISISYPLNINTCTEEELMTIDGIGEARASAIIQYREYLGGYSSVDQIMSIKGFGEKLYESVAPFLTV